MQFLLRVLVSFWEIMSIEVITQFRLSAICWCLNVWDLIVWSFWEGTMKLHHWLAPTDSMMRLSKNMEIIMCGPASLRSLNIFLWRLSLMIPSCVCMEDYRLNCLFWINLVRLIGSAIFPNQDPCAILYGQILIYLKRKAGRSTAEERAMSSVSMLFRNLWISTISKWWLGPISSHRMATVIILVLNRNILWQSGQLLTTAIAAAMKLQWCEWMVLTLIILSNSRQLLRLPALAFILTTFFPTFYDVLDLIWLIFRT